MYLIGFNSYQIYEKNKDYVGITFIGIQQCYQDGAYSKEIFIGDYVE